MSYISAFMDGDVINLIERDKSGSRTLKQDEVEHVFYTLDEFGSYRTIFGDLCKKHTFNNRGQFYKAKKQFPESSIYEDDVNPVFRYLSKNYNFDDIPDLNVCFYDIEVAYHPKTKYSNPTRADNEVICISLYHSWSETMYMLTMPPETLTLEEAEEVCKRIKEDKENLLCNTEFLVVDNEADLLKSFLYLLEDADVITGWNSKMYDFKYLTNRIPKVIGPNYLKYLCLFGKEPVEKTKFNEKIKKEEFYYDCVGRVHLDYMELYKKYTYTELTGGYSLDNVCSHELNEKKVEYDISLDHLFKYDFENFIRYSIKDTYLIKKLDDEKKFIDLTNLLAHNNGVLMETTMGTVALTEQAILNEGHYYGDETLIFPSKTKEGESESGAAGAFVSPPQVGIRKLVAGNDINSLYPSTLRALNMSPETLVAQIDTTETDEYVIEQVNTGKKETPREAWGDLFNTFEFDYVKAQSDKPIKMTFNRTNETIEVPAYKIYDLIFNDDKYVVSANGTIFTTETTGIIPRVLARWYAERKEMQAKAEYWEKKLSEAETEDEKTEAKRNFQFWDQRQLAKKINLNALYGALLNKYFRFYDKRLGQSTTLTGRSITRHMSSKINELIEGDYNYMGNSIIYGDSVTGDTLINTSEGNIPIEDIFEKYGEYYWSEPIYDSENNKIGTKEYTQNKMMKVLTFDDTHEETYFGFINYVYRHKTNKGKWEIVTNSGNNVCVTEDHSVMVLDNTSGSLKKIKPENIEKNDIVIISDGSRYIEGYCSEVNYLGNFDNEYVYDIGMKNENHNWFFGNSILLKNTDSSYFSMYEPYKNSNDKEKEKMADVLFKDKDLAIDTYDNIADKVNESFPTFMDEHFNTGLDNGRIIKAGRENLSDYGLFIKKKRYAMNLIDKDGIRQDKNGKSGKLKVMGIEIKRSDTPKIIQDVLQKGLDMLLHGEDEREVMNYFIEFKQEILEKSPWLLGRPSGANAVEHYSEIYKEIVNGERKKQMIPAAIMGAIAWNELLDFHNEDHMSRIGNGSKVIVCPLKANDYGFNRISYPTEQTSFPDWFKELPFDMDEMIEKIFYKKVNNIFGVLDWDLNLLKASKNFHDIFQEDED